MPHKTPYIAPVTMSVFLERIPRPMWQRFRVQAISENTTMRDLLIRVVSDYLKTAKVKP